MFSIPLSEIFTDSYGKIKWQTDSKSVILGATKIILDLVGLKYY